jgi:hypothetical protein
VHVLGWWYRRRQKTGLTETQRLYISTAIFSNKIRLPLASMNGEAEVPSDVDKEGIR